MFFLQFLLKYANLYNQHEVCLSKTTPPKIWQVFVQIQKGTNWPLLTRLFA